VTEATPSNQTSILVRIPTPLRRLTGGQGEVTAEGRTVQELLDALERQFPGVKERLYDENGQLRRFVNIYINDEDIRFAQGLETALKKGDELSIVPAIAGGEEPPITDTRPLGNQGGPGRGGIGASAQSVGGAHRPPHSMEPIWPA
jgi:molybdopterin synthase sulfur carrier subunit